MRIRSQFVNLGYYYLFLTKTQAHNTSLCKGKKPCNVSLH
jgi:hypothetical protein